VGEVVAAATVTAMIEEGEEKEAAARFFCVAHLFEEGASFFFGSCARTS
jgi:recombinational DNA repair protein (RecF pathway)